MRDTAEAGEAYLLYHSIGQYSGKAADLKRGMDAFCDSWAACDDGQWGFVLGQRQRFIDLWRGIVNAPEDTMTTTENVTSGLASIIGALPDKYLKGKQVLVAEDCFPSLHFLLTGLAPRLGFTLRTVPLRQGATWVEDEDFIDAWTPEVGLALLTWVSSTSSHRCDLERLVAHGREMGSVIGTDITQAAGLLPYDVHVPEVDFTLSTSLKWMCGTPGAGVIYVSPRLIPECHPDLRGWFSQDNPFSWGLDAFEFATGIRRFDHGTPASVPAVASLPALEWYSGQDHAAILSHNRELSAILLDGFDDLNLRLASPRDPDQRGGSLMVTLPDKLTGADVVSALRDAGIHADSRSQTLRMSPGVITTRAGVEQALETLASIVD